MRSYDIKFFGSKAKHKNAYARRKAQKNPFTIADLFALSLYSTLSFFFLIIFGVYAKIQLFALFI